MRKVYSVFTNNKGEPLSDIIVKFRIVGKNRQQISVEDKYTGEAVLDKEIGVQSDKLGRMEVELWENSRSNTENYYLVELVLDRIFRHIIFLPQGDNPIELYKLIAESEKNPRYYWTSDPISRVDFVELVDQSLAGVDLKLTTDEQNVIDQFMNFADNLPYQPDLISKMEDVDNTLKNRLRIDIPLNLKTTGV